MVQMPMKPRNGGLRLVGQHGIERAAGGQELRAR
jgi:hypothetical protein